MDPTGRAAEVRWDVEAGFERTENPARCASVGRYRTRSCYGVGRWVALFLGLATLGCVAGGPVRSVPSSPPPHALPGRVTRRWVLYVRPVTEDRWTPTARAFPSAEACLRVSDRLNNQDPRHIYDCDERSRAPPQGGPQGAVPPAGVRPVSPAAAGRSARPRGG